jgi:hypothetical protein
VDVGGYALWIECQGDGSPTVILDAGLGTPSNTWDQVVPQVAQFTQVCRYDRAGLGKSDVGPKPRTSQKMVEELYTLLSNAGIRGALVLVGHSFAGLNIRLYASTYPQEVVGLVFVDALHPDLETRLEPLLSPQQVEERRQELELNKEGVRFEDILESAKQAKTAGPLPDVPVIVIRHGLPLEASAREAWPSEAVEKLWEELQTDLAKLTSQGRVVVAQKSQHLIQETEPELVSQAIELVARAAR